MASTALTAEGRIEPHIPDTNARDELGALARSYDTLLGRLQEYTNYLQTLGTKLSHELRTPLTIVSSSLDNLSSEDKLPPPSQSYIERARSGANRMHAILTALSEATRVEQIIEHTERVRFDVRELVQNMGQAYQQTFVGHRIETQLPEEPCLVEGSPDLIAQLLDKLMDNASDSRRRAADLDRARTRPRSCTLTVRNEGRCDNRCSTTGFSIARHKRTSTNGNRTSAWASTSCGDRGLPSRRRHRHEPADHTGVEVSLELPLSGRLKQIL